MADNQAAGVVDRRISEELRATLAAYHELGPAYEQQVIDSFLDRIRPALHALPAPSAPQPPMRYRGHRRNRGLLIGLAILFGWVAFASPLFGHGRHSARFGTLDGPVSPFTPPGISAPALPVAPQPPSSGIQ